MALQLSALILFLAGTAGLLIHSTLLTTGRIRAGFFCFYTNLSNLVVVLYELALALALFWPESTFCRFLTDVRVSFSMAMGIWVTHLIYHFMLLPDARRKGKKFDDFSSRVGNLFAHYIIPLLVVGQWLLLADKTQLHWTCALWWQILPSLYAVFALLRAQTGRPIGHTKLIYPYFFMDIDRLGIPRFLLILLALLAVFFLLGLLLVGAGTLLQ